jgi:hypothetical protein
VKELVDLLEDMMKMGKGKKRSYRNLLNLKVNRKDIKQHRIFNSWHGYCLKRNGKVAFGGINNG